MKIANLFIIIFFILSCNTEYSKKKVEIPSSITNWNVNDEPPSIKLCDQIESELNRNICFQNELIKLIYENIDFSEIVVERDLNDTLILSILINKKGEISFFKSVIPLEIKNQIPLIDSILNKAIKRLPRILPATKTNIGVQVNSSFELPLILKTK
tara:strand:+ start:543 stop:1010 length:468 start_codon:yes stop_codon:yes gene_type:complete